MIKALALRQPGERNVTKCSVYIITHNKITMKMANQLLGVTMHEAGVSRMVAVDIDDMV